MAASLAFGSISSNDSANSTPSSYDSQVVLEITIDSSKIDTPLTYFPLPIHLSQNSGQFGDDTTRIFDELGTDYEKLLITQSDGVTPLFVEVESWDAAAKEAVLWVSSPSWTISSSQDTVIFLYADDQNPVNSSFVGPVGSAPFDIESP